MAIVEDSDRCVWPRCRSLAVMTYLQRPICGRCWDRVCDLDYEGRSAEVDLKLRLNRSTPIAVT